MRSSSAFPTGPILLALALLAALLSLAPGAAVAQAPERCGGPTTVYLYRHAERASDTDRDSPLSATGRARAEALARALEESGVSAVYVTRFRRTRETALPLVERLNLPVRAENSGEPAAVEALVATVLERHCGESVLVVGHSNTVPALVHAFGGPWMADFEASRYGDLFILTIPVDGPVRTVRARVDPEPARPGR